MSLGPSGLSADFHSQALPRSVLSLVWSAVAEAQEDRGQASFLEQACLGPSLHSLVRRIGGVGTGCIPLVPEGRTDGSSCGSAQAPPLSSSPPRVVCVPGCDSRKCGCPLCPVTPSFPRKEPRNWLASVSWRTARFGVRSETGLSFHFLVCNDRVIVWNEGCSDLRDMSDQISLS